MRELAKAQTQLERARRRNDVDDVEDAEFEDRPRTRRRNDRELADSEAKPRERGSLWIPLAVGLGIIAVVGVAGVIVYLLVRRDRDGGSTTLGSVDPRYFLPPPPAPAPAAAAPQIYVINAGGGTVTSPATPAIVESIEPPKPVAIPSTAPMLHRLPPPTSSIPAALACTGAHAIEVNVAVLEPSGATAMLAFSPDMSTGLIVLRAGEERRIRIDRRQTLYGKGQAGHVTVTLASTS
jgi:hypothetical protein